MFYWPIIIFTLLLAVGSGTDDGYGVWVGVTGGGVIVIVGSGVGTFCSWFMAIYAFPIRNTANNVNILIPTYCIAFIIPYLN